MTRRISTAPPDWTARRVVLATITVLAIACSGWLLYRFRTVWVTLLVAIVLASSINPTRDWLARRGVSRTIAAFVAHVPLSLY